MAIRFAAEAWRTNLETGHPSAKDFRFYVDFRQQAYPPLDDTTTYNVITSADNEPGSHNLAGGYCNYMLDMPTSFTLALRVLPSFAYNVAGDQPLVSWYVDADHYFTVLYTAADDKITVKYKDGTNDRTMKSAAYASDLALQVWQDIVVVADLANSDGLLYIDRDAKASDWSAGADVKATNFPKLQLRGENGTAGNWIINYVRLFPSVEATAAQVAADLVMLNEEIYWPLNGVAIGSTRCNVTTFVESFDYDAKVERPENGAQCANSLSVVLRSNSGEFADDQYAAFDASASVYNGLSSQKYLQRRCPVIAEHWYSHVFDPFFVGRLDGSCFSRTSPADDLSRVTIVCEDFVSEIAREESKHGTYYEDHDLCSTTESDSLVHKFVRLASQRSVKNYASNSSFENATIANSWAVSGAGATLVRAAGGLFGTFQGDMDYGAATCTTAQTVTFTGDARLSVGDSYTFSIYLKSASACAYNIYLAEADSGGDNDDTSAAWTLAGGDGWKRFSVTHTVTDATSDRLIARISCDDNVLLSMDGAMWTVGKTAYNFFVLNNNDGVAGVESADDADSATYDLIGFDADPVAIEHPWAVIAQNENAWDPLKDIANATAAYYMGMDPAGTFRYRSPFKTGYTDPSSTLTITAGVSDVSTELAEMANAVVIRGSKILKDTDTREVWNWGLSSVAPASGGYETLSDAEVFPATATYPEFWAQYTDFTERIESQNVDSFGSWISGKHRKVYTFVREVKNEKDVEIIGVKSPSMVYDCYSNLRILGGTTTRSLDLTKSEDYASKSTAARIRLTNSSGADRYLFSWAIRGLLVRRFSGEQGWVNDQHFDSEAIEKSGRVEVKIANNYIVTSAQVNQLADYHWKANRTQRHSYTVTQFGTRLYYDPGMWYTLQVGGVGQREYIDSVVACESVRVHGSPSELGDTEVTFREIQQNWTFDSNAYARYLASGRLNDNTPNNALVVASSTYAGPADYYCDGTDDQSEINAALLRSNHVQLTEGVFYITAAVEMKSGCTLRGRGAGTILEKNCNDYCIEAVGGAGTEINNAIVSDLVISRNTADTNSKSFIYVDYGIDCSVERVFLIGSAYYGVQDTTNDTGLKVINCNITAAEAVGGVGVAIAGNNAIVYGNTIHDMGNTESYSDGILIGGDDCVAANNLIYAVPGLGISVYDGDSNTLANNKVRDCASVGPVSYSGIYIAAGVTNTYIGNNSCIDNGNRIDNTGNITTVPTMAGEAGGTNTNSTWASSIEQAKYGATSTKLIITTTASEASGDAVDNNNNDDMHTLIAGYSYRFSASAYVPSVGGPSAAEVSIRIGEYYSAAWNWTSDAASVQNAWEDLGFDITLNAATTGIIVRFAIASTASDGEYAYFDDIILKPIGIHNQHSQNYLDLGTGTQLG